MKKLFLISLCVPAIAAQDYKIENITLPEGSPPEVGGIDFASDGSMFVVLRRGDVFKTMPKADSTEFEWQLFATGFHNGCGIDAVTPNKVRVTQMAEMTEAEDTNGDGKADKYRVFSSGWGLSGNYHETNTLTEDGKGGYYIAVGTASYNGPTFKHTLADYSETGRRGRNFSGVKWRGWVLHADAKGEITPVASGFRMHNGIYMDAEGNVWASDNQGDWKATTPLYHVEKGNFYGHPSSLVWDPKWPADKDPLATFVADLNAYNDYRTKPAVQLPHKAMNRSASEPMVIPDNFPHFPGQMILLDNNGTRISRIMLEKVNGEYQGACTHFINGQGLRSGNNRVRFSPDGKQIYVGQTVRGWGKLAEGLQRITPTTDKIFDVDRVSIQPDGFLISFTGEPSKLEGGISIDSFTYQSKWTYGSPEADKKKHEVTINPAENSLKLIVQDFQPGRVYQINLPDYKSKDGESLRNRLVYYTANQLPK